MNPRGSTPASRWSPPAVGTFEFFFRPWMRRKLERIHVRGEAVLDRSGPLLLAANHVSWWDPFVVREIQRRRRPGAPLHVLMGEAELRRFAFFRRLGVIGIDGQSPRSVLRALRLLERHLDARPDASVLIFPQGRIWPSHRRPLGFQRGIETIAGRIAGAEVIPVALHVEPLNHVRPSVFATLGLPTSSDVRSVESAVEDQLDGILDDLARHGEDIGEFWGRPAADEFLHPATGVRGAAVESA